jgi:tetratricopeptide (TPR) repeat protein
MRLALLVHTPTAPTARADIEALRARLQRPELGFWVVEAAASDDLALGLPRALEGTPAGSALLVVVMSEVRRGPAGSVEVTGTTRSVRLEELRAALVTSAPGQVLLVFDGLRGEEDPEELTGAMIRAVAPGTSGVGLLCCLRPASAPPGDMSPLASALCAVVDDTLAGGQTPTIPAGLMAGLLRDDAELGARVDAIHYTPPSSGELVLVRPPPRPFASPPTADESFAEANELLAQGRLEEALEACKRVLFQVANDREKKSEVYVRIAAIKQRQGKPREAIFNLEKSLSIDPKHRTALEGLVLLAVEEKRWSDVARLGDQLLAALDDEDARLQAMLDLAGLLLDGANDEAKAVELLERARALRPKDERPLERLAWLYDRSARFEELVEVLEAWAATSDNSYQKAARFAAAGRVASKGLKDRPRAIRLLDQALRLRRDDPEVAEELARELEDEGLLPQALRAFQLSVHGEPRRASAYRGLVQLAERTGRPGLAGAAAMALCHLNQADIDEELLADQHRPEGPVAARRPLPPSAWEGQLAPPVVPGVRGVLAAIEAAAIEAKIDELREAQRLPKLDPQTRQDPQTSTVSALRVFAFAGKLLGVTLPELYLLPEVPGGVAAVATERPTTVLGRSLLSGRSTVELAFLMARHLAYHRPGARLSLYYPSLAELTALLHAAVQIGRPGVSVSPPHAAAAGRLYAALHSRLDEAARQNLETALNELDQAGRRPDLPLWLRRLELTATRAGLLACGDLGVAARLVEDDPAPVGDLSPRAKADDLLVFATSDAYEALRREILG